MFLMCCCRFQKALESAKHDEDMWVLLANANIHDAKARKVSSTLRAAAATGCDSTLHYHHQGWQQ
jgi:hypothetical protein